MNRSIAGWVTHRWAKWVVLGVALLLTAGMGFLAGKLTGVEKNDISSWLPGGAESTKVINASGSFTDKDLIPAIVLYTRDSGITPADTAAVKADVQRLGAVKDVRGQVQGPVPSKDGKALEVYVPVHLSSDGWDKLPGILDDIKAASRTTGDSGLTVHYAGPAALGADQSEAFKGIDGILLLSAALVVIVMLLLTYRSPILWLIPVVSAVFSLVIAQGFVYLLAKAGLTVNAQSAGILTVLVFGAGTDYALLLVARYREELHRFEDRHEAMAHALHRAGPAILASGATVVVGLLCLLFAQMNSTASLGPVTAAGILVALLLMLTLLPALLVIVGRWIFWPLVPRYGTEEPTANGLWARTGRRIAKAPRATWIVTAVVLAFFAVGGLQLNANGLSNADSFTQEQPSTRAEKVLAEHFPGGVGSPVMVVARAAQAGAVKSAFADVKGIDASSIVVSPTKDGKVFLQGTLTSAADSQTAKDTVDRARASLHRIAGADALVGGDTAINHDVQKASGHDNTLIIPIILAAVFLILALLLRALVAPLVLLVTVVLSFGASIGIAALFFRHVFGFAGADTSFPLFAFVFLVALGIDYNIFLMTRVREEALQHGTRRGALIGLGATGGVITSAGLVLAGTFAALATLPIVFLAELGFVVAVGVLLDTIIVRSVLVTALNLDIGRRMWLPSKLAQKEDEPEPAAV